MIDIKADMLYSVYFGINHYGDTGIYFGVNEAFSTIYFMCRPPVNRTNQNQSFRYYHPPEEPPPPDDPPPPENPPEELLPPELHDPPEPPDEKEKPPIEALPLLRRSFLAFLNHGVVRMYNFTTG